MTSLSEKKKVEAEIEKLKEKIDNLGGQFSATKIIETALNFLRHKVLGWSVSSAITNFVEGQIANTIGAHLEIILL